MATPEATALLRYMAIAQPIKTAAKDGGFLKAPERQEN
jgi:hypothetical protein